MTSATSVRPNFLSLPSADELAIEGPTDDSATCSGRRSTKPIAGSLRRPSPAGSTSSPTTASSSALPGCHCSRLAAPEAAAILRVGNTYVYESSKRFLATGDEHEIPAVAGFRMAAPAARS